VSSKINGFEGSPPAQVGAGNMSQGVQNPASGSPAGSSGSSDSIHITDTASQLAALEQATRELPAVNGARVAAARSAIEQGTYTVSSESVADNLVQMERSLGSLGSLG
jgi:negative regulator of flagellin synthesis FlgM